MWKMKTSIVLVIISALGMIEKEHNSTLKNLWKSQFKRNTKMVLISTDHTLRTLSM